MNVLTYIIIGIAVSSALGYMRKPKEPKGNTVTLPALMAVIGAVGMIVFAVLALLSYEAEGLPTFVVLMLFELLSVSLVMAYCNCRISYDETSFTVKNFWGITRTYTYDDITWRKGTRDVTLYVGGHVVRIDELSVGKTEFLCFSEARYRKTHGGRAIPMKSPDGKRSFDLFNGNVENPYEFIIVFGVMLVLVLFMFGFLAYEALPVKAEELTHTTIRVEGYEVVEENLYLYAEGEELPFRIRGYATALEHPDAFLRQCEEQSFSVGYISYENADEPYHSLHYVMDESGADCLTMEAAYKEHLKYMKDIAMLMCGMALVMILFIVGSICVGRHPERFSPWFIRLFFKEGYINMPEVPKNKKR